MPASKVYSLFHLPKPNPLQLIMDDHRQLLSILITLLTLTLLYLPIHLLFFSSLFLSLIAIFLILLRSATLHNIESKTADQGHPVGSLRCRLNLKDEVCLKSNLLHFQLELDDGVCSKLNLDSKFDDPFVEWDVRAPLDVIYEEESEEDDDSDKPATHTYLTRHSSSLSNYFPETDSDTTSSDEYPDWDGYSSPGKICYKWDEDEPESEQVIAEIRAGTYTFNFKEKARKHIYSDSEGEMHWSTNVYHASEFTYGNVHLLPKTSHLWILAGGSCEASVVPFSLHKDQDQWVN